MSFFLMSGWQDSNLRPPRPKRGAITGLRYTPKISVQMKGFKKNLQNNIRKNYICHPKYREVAEWLKAHAWKAC